MPLAAQVRDEEVEVAVVSVVEGLHAHARFRLAAARERAAERHGLDLPASWMIGDILDDVEAGHRAGCRAVLLDVNNETEWRRGPLRTPDFVARDLIGAARHIVGHAA